jgi:hypothetical protein
MPVVSLIKKWLESGNNVISHELENLLQHGFDSETFEVFSRRTAERYKDGSLSLSFHFHVTLPKTSERLVSEKFEQCRIVQRNSNIAEYCAIADFLSADEHFEERSIPTGPINESVARNGGDQIQSLVLISFVQCGQGQKSLIPSMIRLQTLDECRSRRGYPIKPVPFFGFFEVLRTATDGERSFSTWGVGRIRQDQLPD